MFDTSEFRRSITSQVMSFCCKPNIVSALFLQAALFFVLPWVFSFFLPKFLSFFSLLLVQAFLASFFLMLLRWNWWWILIQSLISCVIYFSLNQKIAFDYAWLFFLILLFLHIGALRNRVPYFPSNKHTFPVVSFLLPPKANSAVLDLGAGYGRVLRELQFYRQDLRFFGVELAMLPYLYGRLLKSLGLFRGHIKYGDIFKQNLSTMDFVYCYLSSAVMLRLGEKIQIEMRPGCTFVSCEFPVENFCPDLTINYKNAPPLYVWRI